MLIIRRLTEILGDDWTPILQPFCVPDLEPIDTADSPASWLVCESPHTNEVANRHPLAGTAGKKVTECLVNAGVSFTGNEEQRPIGELIRGREIAARLGIINVCLLPLQWQAYVSSAERIPADARVVLRKWLLLMGKFAKIKDYSGSSQLDPHDDIQQAVLDCFKERADNLIQPSDRVLLCGKCAEACWRLSQRPTPDNVRSVSHPSRRNPPWVAIDHDRNIRQPNPAIVEKLRWLMRT